MPVTTVRYQSAPIATRRDRLTNMPDPSQRLPYSPPSPAPPPMPMPMPMPPNLVRSHAEIQTGGGHNNGHTDQNHNRPISDGHMMRSTGSRPVGRGWDHFDGEYATDGPRQRERYYDYDTAATPMSSLATWVKVLPSITGVITVVLILSASYYRDNYSVRGIPFSTSSHVISQAETFLLLVAALFSLNLVLVFVAALLDEHTSNEIHRTLYDLLFHLLGGLLYLTASIWTIVFENRFRTEEAVKVQFMAAGALGIISGLAHLGHALISYRGYQTT